MRLLDFLILMAICLAWALNIVVGKIVLSHYAVPPLYYAAIRFLGTTIVLAPLLRPLPKQFGKIAVVALLIGALHFGLMFVGLASATPSSAAIVLQLSIPMTALLSVVFLGERMSILRAAGIAIAFAGVMMIIWDPTEAKASPGLLALAISAAAIAVGSVLLKRLQPINPLRLQGWVACLSWGPLALSSVLLEDRQIETSLNGGYAFAGALAFSVIIVTVVAYSTYLGLLQRYDASMLVPLTLAMPVMAVLLGVFVTGDRLGPSVIAGSALCLLGVLLVLRGGPRNRAAKPLEHHSGR